MHNIHDMTITVIMYICIDILWPNFNCLIHFYKRAKLRAMSWGTGLPTSNLNYVLNWCAEPWGSRGATLISWHGFYRGRKEASGAGWGLLPHNPTLQNLKGQILYALNNAFAEQATSKHRRFALTLRQPLDSSSLSHSLWSPQEIYNKICVKNNFFSEVQLLSDAFPRCPVSEVWEEAQGGLLPPLIPSPRQSPQNPASSHPNYATPFL